MRYPDFFIAGAAKSGTTSLWKYLGCHERIFMTKEIQNKELSYFCNDYGVKSLEQYLSFFEKATKHQLVGEVCHTYLTSPESAQWIKSEVPNAKIIIILRNPANRAYSLYKWMIMEGYENQPTFEKALEIEPIRRNNSNFKLKRRTYFRNWFYFETGLYSQQVKRFYEIFGKKNTLVLLFEDFKSDPTNVMSKIFSHLDLTPTILNKEQRRVENESKEVRSVRVQFYIRNRLPKILTKLSIGSNVQRLIQNFFMSLNIVKNKRNRLKLDTYNQLMNMYLNDIEELEKITGLNVKSKWLRN